MHPGMGRRGAASFPPLSLNPGPSALGPLHADEMKHVCFALLFAAFFAPVLPAWGQDNSQPAPVELTREEDHQLMLELLNISSIRPGANGRDTTAATYANYDEATANPYPSLPDPLLTNGRQKVTKGIIGLVNKGQPRSEEDWGALRAWAWGASRLLDYFETDAAVDARQVGLQGHSRYGKATVVAMAYDQRFAIAPACRDRADGRQRDLPPA